MTTPLPPAPAGLVHALEAADALSALLVCTDLARWDSLARPHPHALARLAFLVVGELQTAAREAFAFEPTAAH